MFWRLALPALLAWALCVAAEPKKTRPQSSIPSPYKLKGNDLLLSSQQQSPRAPKGKQDVLSSSREALVVTERKYLKSDWCKTQPLRQTVSEEGCASHTLLNRFCYGQCNSFYIPRHVHSSAAAAATRGRRQRRRQTPRGASFQSCAFCRPHRVTTVTLRLHCPGLEPPFRHRKVQRVKQCRCVSVSVNDTH